METNTIKDVCQKLMEQNYMLEDEIIVLKNDLDIGCEHLISPINVIQCNFLQQQQPRPPI